MFLEFDQYSLKFQLIKIYAKNLFKKCCGPWAVINIISCSNATNIVFLSLSYRGEVFFVVKSIMQDFYLFTLYISDKKWLAEHLRFLHVLSLTLSTMSPFNKSSLLDTNPKACMWESSVV